MLRWRALAVPFYICIVSMHVFITMIGTLSASLVIQVGFIDQSEMSSYCDNDSITQL